MLQVCYQILDKTIIAIRDFIMVIKRLDMAAVAVSGMGVGILGILNGSTNT